MQADAVVSLDPEAERMCSLLEASIRQARIDRARAVYAAAKQKILGWPPGDRDAAVGVLSEALGAADALIDAIDG